MVKTKYQLANIRIDMLYKQSKKVYYININPFPQYRLLLITYSTYALVPFIKLLLHTCPVAQDSLAYATGQESKLK